MGPLQLFPTSLFEEEQYLNSSPSFPPIALQPKFNPGQDVAALKANILTCHAYGLLPTRKLFESIQKQQTVNQIRADAANFAQESINEFAQSLSEDELDRFDSKEMYRHLMEEYMTTVSAQITLDVQETQYHLQEMAI